MSLDRRPFRSRLVSAGAAAAVLAALAAPTALAHPEGWMSGTRNTGTTSATTFAGWRGTGLGVVAGWINWRDGWAGMYTYASGSSPRTLKRHSPNVSLGHGLFPAGGSLAA